MGITDLKGQVKHDEPKTFMEMTLQVSCLAPGNNAQTPTCTTFSRSLLQQWAEGWYHIKTSSQV